MFKRLKLLGTEEEQAKLVEITELTKDEVVDPYSKYIYMLYAVLLTIWTIYSIDVGYIILPIIDISALIDRISLVIQSIIIFIVIVLFTLSIYVKRKESRESIKDNIIAYLMYLGFLLFLFFASDGSLSSIVQPFQSNMIISHQYQIYAEILAIALLLYHVVNSFMQIFKAKTKYHYTIYQIFPFINIVIVVLVANIAKAYYMMTINSIGITEWMIMEALGIILIAIAYTIISYLTIFKGNIQQVIAITRVGILSKLILIFILGFIIEVIMLVNGTSITEIMTSNVIYLKISMFLGTIAFMFSMIVLNDTADFKFQLTKFEEEGGWIFNLFSDGTPSIFGFLLFSNLLAIFIVFFPENAGWELFAISILLCSSILSILLRYVNSKNSKRALFVMILLFIVMGISQLYVSDLDTSNMEEVMVMLICGFFLLLLFIFNHKVGYRFMMEDQRIFLNVLFTIVIIIAIIAIVGITQQDCYLNIHT